MAQSDYRKLTPSQLKRLGYSPTSERYIHTGAKLNKGNTISRRAYDNKSDRYAVFGGRHNFERRYQVPSWRYFVEKGAEAEGKDARKLLTSSTDPLARQAYAAAKAKQKGGRAARSPKGALAKYLVRIGLRQPDWTFDVGDTPPS